MTGSIIWGVVALVGGSAFVLLWWRIADNWADEEHKRFKVRDDGPEPTVIKRSDIEG
jgi:hypothetical protein